MRPATGLGSSSDQTSLIHWGQGSAPAAGKEQAQAAAGHRPPRPQHILGAGHGAVPGCARGCSLACRPCCKLVTSASADLNSPCNFCTAHGNQPLAATLPFHHLSSTKLTFIARPHKKARCTKPAAGRCGTASLEVSRSFCFAGALPT